MALSGTFYGTSSNQYVQPKITWSGKQSQSGNYTDITATLYYSRTNSGYETYGTWSGGIVINGVKTTASKYISITQNSNTVAVSATTRVPHNADGTKSVTISAYGGISGTSFNSTSISATVTLNSISRGTIPTISGTLNVGNTVTISVASRASSSYTHDLTYSWGSSLTNIEIVKGLSDTTYSWTIPKMLAEYITTSTTGTLQLKCVTKNGSTVVGTQTKNFTISVPNTAEFNPQIDSITFFEGGSLPAELEGVYVQGYSKIFCTVSAGGAKIDGSDKRNSKISNITVQHIGLNLKDSRNYNSGYMTQTMGGWLQTSSNNALFRVTVTDSRSRQVIQEKNVTVQSYTPPIISEFKAERCTSSGTLDDDGEYLKITIKATIKALSNKNAKRYVLSYVNGNSVTQITSGNFSGYTDTVQTFVTTTKFSGSQSWEIIGVVYDSLNTSSPARATYTVPVAATFMDWKSNGKGFALGKVSERDGFECKFPSYFYEPLNIVKVENGAETVIPINYITDEGTSGGWTYRKWNNGTMECWRDEPISAESCNTAVGTWYRTKVFIPADYPFAFVSDPNVTMFYRTTKGSGGLVWSAGGTESEPTLRPEAYYVIRMSSAASITGKVSIYAIGKWK